ncbi:hypothetical protein PN419_02320 [Halorubrum ezzemoulense]|jgi:hypothetical protein|uniref:hypothetical protein n=1 Tax=Halorubrum TaxID=56688 RepID=UPI000B12391F|nr:MULTISPECIES: hypothetical protein [Halorubrum]MDB2225656.1 hypothetical protein [Halorubrum ezzemoulense]MDB2236992.1 hypothetical protein [Halorubrum ezzemoulense]MDB2241510.1 hypothetical protein [Halorubrum ezzemoulense]MDB2247019.1 hypothetical protein [Halorubrum ezzemoulense]MDB2250556.1 hypothetical protein [Halorubrum ezzemoulense]
MIGTWPVATALAAVTEQSVSVIGRQSLPIQVDVVGGGGGLAAITIAAFFLSVLLAVFVTYRFARGYLRTRRRPLLFLTLGLLLLAPLPMFLRLASGNVAWVTATERTVVVTASKLCGLLLILGVVYR